MAKVHAFYFTDPLCVWSWGSEPAFRRLMVEFGDEVQITYVMAGMARDSASLSDMASKWLDAADRTRMPVDPRPWLDGAGAVQSSYPASMAVVAAREHGHEAAYLRRLREGLMCGRRKLDHAEALGAEALEIPGLDAARFAVDLGSHAIIEAFGADLERAREAGGGERPVLPSLELRPAEGGESRLLTGPPDSYDEWRAALVAAGAEPDAAPAPTVVEALRAFGTMAEAELAEVCRLPEVRVAGELWGLAQEWRATPRRVLTGHLWSLS